MDLALLELCGLIIEDGFSPVPTIELDPSICDIMSMDPLYIAPVLEIELFFFAPLDDVVFWTLASSCLTVCGSRVCLW